jgi:hypothetical protein
MHQKILELPTLDSYFILKIGEDWGQKVSGLVLRYDQNVLLDSIISNLHNGLSYYCQPFHCPISVENLGLDCNVEYTDANKGVMPASHIIWVQ